MEEIKEDRVEYKIYKIVCNETGEVYFGKTIKTLQARLREHKYHLTTCSSKQIILRNKYRIEQIDSTFDEDESVRLERRYIENNECVNIKIPGRTQKEYYEDNREEISKKKKVYREAHREEISEKKKVYREAHKEEISEKKKVYREAHKEEISEKAKIKYTCKCGTTLTIQKRSRHERSQRHINFINLNNNNNI